MGRATVVGGKIGMEAPVGGILASDIAVGSIVKLMENGSPVEYLVVHQGRQSSLYDSSCNGVWLMRKNIFANQQWSSNSNTLVYENSTIHSYLNSTFLNLFDSTTKAQIKTVKIPYVYYPSTGVVLSGSDGLSTQIFIPSAIELGFVTQTGTHYPVGDGACLSYFSGTSNTDSKRIAYQNGTATVWWTRSVTAGSTTVDVVDKSGGIGASFTTSSRGIRPALILPSNAMFDKNTLVLKGVK